MRQKSSRALQGSSTGSTFKRLLSISCRCGASLLLTRRYCEAQLRSTPTLGAVASCVGGVHRARSRRRSSALRHGNEVSFVRSHASATRRRTSFELPHGPKNFCANRRIRACATRNPSWLRQLFFRLGLAAPAALERAKKIPPKDNAANASVIVFKKTPRFIGVSKNRFACSARRPMDKGESAWMSDALIGRAAGAAPEKKLRKTVDTLKKRD